MKYLLAYSMLLMGCSMASTAQAQNPVYFFYDPACMQQLDYAKEGKVDELAHTDYYTNIADDKQAILRVQKDPANLNRKMMVELPEKPILCGDRTYLTPALMKDINANRRLAYMVIQMGEQYAVYNIHSAATLEANAKGIVYTDPVYGFDYQYAISKTGEILNKGNNKERNVFFEQQTKTVCLPTYEFKVISRHIETPIKHFRFVNTIGMERWYTAQGNLQLRSINGIPLAQVIAQRCNSSVEAVQPIVNAAPATPTPSLPDTIGMTAAEKKVWLARRNNNFVATTPTARPSDNSTAVSTPPSSGVPMGTIVQQPQAQLLPGGIYIVQEKDNLYNISEQFGVSIERLVEINGLNTYELGLNQPLKVVDDGSVPHTDRNPKIVVDPVAKTKTTIHLVEQGQTLYGISKRYGITLKDIYALNASLTSDMIDINQPIVVGYQKLEE